MAKNKIQKWSYSRWSMYHKCPAQYHWHYVLKNPRGSSHALERGIDIHNKAENFVNGKIKGMPKELEKFAPEFKILKREFKEGKGYTEPDISIDINLEPSTKFKTNWFIGFADFAHVSDTLTVIDYKTGRKYPEHREQGHAYSMSLLCRYPDLPAIDVEFWYLDHGVTMDFHYKREDLPRMIEIWKRRISKMYADKKFEATPNKFCNWCARNKKHGGDCDG